MEHKFSLGSFHWENKTTFSEFRLFGKISSGTNQKAMLHFTSQPEFPEFFERMSREFQVFNKFECPCRNETCIIMWFLLLYKSLV